MSRWGTNFVLASVTIPLAIGGLPSMGRYTAVLFPMFLLVGLAPSKIRPVLLGLAFVAQVVLATQFFTSQPVF